MPSPEYITFPKPQVVGKLSAKDFARIQPDRVVERDSLVLNIHQELQPLYKEIASKARVPFRLDDKAMAVIQTIKPGESGSPPAASWHTDKSLDQLFSSDFMPTEFLFGEEIAVAALIDILELGDPRERYADLPKTAGDWGNQLGNAGAVATDKRLRGVGLKIWSPKPGEIVHIGREHAHRARTNKTHETVTRRVAILSTSSASPFKLAA